MAKLGALSILLAVALMIYLFNPTTQIDIDSSDPNTQVSIASPAKLNSVQANSAKTIQQLETNDQVHNHDNGVSDKPAEIPQFIKDSLESKRIPASELVEVHHPDGSVSMDLKGQYQHVPVAVIGDDGKVKIIETKIEPINE